MYHKNILNLSNIEILKLNLNLQDMFIILSQLKSLMKWIEFISLMIEILVISLALLLNTLSLSLISERQLYYNYFVLKNNLKNCNFS